MNSKGTSEESKMESVLKTKGDMPIILDLFAQPDSDTIVPIRISADSDPDYIQDFLVKHRTFYEADVLHMMGAVVSPGDILIDVGANLGNHSLFMARYHDVTCYAIEPGKRAHDRLVSNIKLNALSDQILPFELAFGQRVGEGVLIVPEGQLGMAALELYYNPTGAESSKRHNVHIHTLDKFVAEQEISGIRAIKMDVEGAELDVILGGLQTLQTMRPDLFVENGHNKAVLETLTGLGYVMVDAAGRTLVSHFRPREALDIHTQPSVHHTVFHANRLASDIDNLRQRINRAIGGISLEQVESRTALGDSLEAVQTALAHDVDNLHGRMNRALQAQDAQRLEAQSTSENRIGAIDQAISHLHKTMSESLIKTTAIIEDNLKAHTLQQAAQIENLSVKLEALTFSVGTTLSTLIEAQIQREREEMEHFARLRNLLPRIWRRFMSRFQ